LSLGYTVFWNNWLSLTVSVDQILHENMSHFYITLPSDSSAKYFPNNTVAHYTTKLAKQLRLDGEYEVGLCELIYTNSWNNFNPRSMKIECRNQINDRPDGSLIFESGRYADVNSLLKSLNTQMQEHHCIVSLTYDSKKELIIMEVRNEINHLIHVSEEFKKYFGFKNNGPYEDGIYIAETKFDMNAGLQLMYVYSDIASYSTVGDVQTPLLRVCNTEGTHGDVIRLCYTHPHYSPVSRRHIDTIDININDHLGFPFSFESGTSIVTLHFRRINKFLE
jgi:hypothetical protein